MAGMFHHKIPKEVLQLSNFKLKIIEAETTMQFLEYFSESVSENSLRCYDPEDLKYLCKIIQFAASCNWFLLILLAKQQHLYQPSRTQFLQRHKQSLLKLNIPSTHMANYCI